MERFKVLAGLAPYGAVALPFPSNGRGRHREGLVVRFNPATVEPMGWQFPAWGNNVRFGTSSPEWAAGHHSCGRAGVCHRPRDAEGDPARYVRFHNLFSV